MGKHADDELKLRVVSMKSSGMTMAEIAAEVEVPISTIGRWVRQGEKVVPGVEVGMLPVSLGDELDSLMPQAVRDVLEKHRQTAIGLALAQSVLVQAIEQRDEELGVIFRVEAEDLQTAIEAPYINDDGTESLPSEMTKLKRQLAFEETLLNLDILRAKRQQMVIHNYRAAISAEREALGVNSAQTLFTSLRIVMAAGYGVTR